MKKNILFGITLVICLFLVGCDSKKKNEEKVDGDSFKISLYSNSSTGYSWDYKVSEEGIVDIKSVYDDSKCAPDVDGCGGEMIYTIKALKPGKVTLSFKYSFFNDDERPSKDAIYEITVKEDLSIEESHSGSYFDNN